LGIEGWTNVWGEILWSGLLWWLVGSGLIVGLVLVIAHRERRGWERRITFAPREPERTPLEALQLRYVQGEIDREEYEARRRALPSD
jgi:uncharacterized membrane protein